MVTQQQLRQRSLEIDRQKRLQQVSQKNKDLERAKIEAIQEAQTKVVQQSLDKGEAELNKIKEAWYLAKKLAPKGIPDKYINDDLVRGFVREIRENIREAEDSYSRQVLEQQTKIDSIQKKATELNPEQEFQKRVSEYLEGKSKATTPAQKEFQQVAETRIAELKQPISKPTTFEKLKNTYFKAEQKAKEKITSKIIPEIEYSAVADKEKILREMRETKNVFSYLPYPESYKEKVASGLVFGKSYLKGFGEGLRDKPIKTAATTGVFIALPAVLGGAGKVISPVAKALPKASAVVSTGVKVGLPVLYGGSIFFRTAQEPTTQTKAEKLGEITSTEIAPMLIGSEIGTKSLQKVGDWWRTRGRTEVPVEKYVIKDVLAGEKTFPESTSYGYKGSYGGKKQKFDIKVFEKQGYGYHSTGNKFWNEGITPIIKGKSEFEGLYTSPSVSTYFLRQGKGYDLYGGSLLNPVNYPAVAKVTPQSFDIAPIISTGVKGKAGSLAFTGELKPSTAYVTGVKPEIEAVIPFKTGTSLKKTGAGYYFKYGGRRIPVDEFITIGGTADAGTKLFGISELSSYNLNLKSSIFTPSSLLGGVLLSSSPSKNIVSAKSIPSSISPSSSKISSKSFYPSYSFKSMKSMKPMPSLSLISKGSSSKIDGSRSYFPKLSGIETPPYYPSKKREKIKYLGFPSLVSSTAGKIKGSLSVGGGESFDVYIIRNGKQIRVGKSLNKQDALDLGAEKTIKSLAATFFLKKASGIPKDIPDTNIFQKFREAFRRPSSSSKLNLLGEEVWVQKKTGTPNLKGARLGTSGERKEIQMFKLKAPKNFLSSKRKKKIRLI